MAWIYFLFSEGFSKSLEGLSGAMLIVSSLIYWRFIKHDTAADRYVAIIGWASAVVLALHFIIDAIIYFHVIDSAHTASSTGENKMKIATIVFAVLSAISGLFAAYKWYKASKVDVRPFEEVNGKLVEIPTSEVVHWINAFQIGMQKSGSLNKTASIWTAVSIGLAGLSALAGAWPASN